MSRECGDCTVCCTYLRISGLGKPGLTPCVHLKEPAADGYTGEGCAIYGTKPAVCGGYTCAWLDGHGLDEDRPDRSGILSDNVLRIENAIQCKPIRKGAHNTDKGRSAVERISRSKGEPALVCGFPETHMVRVVGRGCC